VGRFRQAGRGSPGRAGGWGWGEIFKGHQLHPGEQLKDSPKVMMEMRREKRPERKQAQNVASAF
jgi:hypothetical protein